MTHKQLAATLVTMGEARNILGYKSRNSIEVLIRSGKLEYVTVSPGTKSSIRLILKDSLEALKGVRNE